MIHLIYAIPPPSNRLLRLMKRFQWKFLPGSRSHTAWRRQPFSAENARRAPYSITAQLFRFLSQRTEVRLYDLLEPGRLRYGKDDIILGHPWPDPNRITNQALLDPHPCKLKALIFPLHHGLPQINEYARPYVEQADLVFGIMGDFWYDTFDGSAFATWKPKLVPLDMAIEADDFPYVKTNFNPPGQRGYLYIGRNAVEKGTDVLSETMGRLPELRAGWIGSGEEIAHVKREAIYASLTPAFARKLAQQYDFLVNTSISDANPTTILEAMAWGFPVACTPQSGYYKLPGLVSLSTRDIEGNAETLRALQYLPESELLSMAAANRQLVETHYTWERFCQTVWSHLEAVL